MIIILQFHEMKVRYKYVIKVENMTYAYKLNFNDEVRRVYE